MRSLPALISISISISISIAVLASAPRVASATPSYPGDVQTHLGLGYTPPCTLCHTGAPMTGSATSAFALAMKGKGLVPLNDPTVDTALNALEAAKIDSDCDGILDVEQIKAGRDPSTGVYIDGSGKTAPADKGCASASSGGGSGTGLPAYGCGAPQAQLASGPTPWQGAVGIATIVGLALTRNRGRRRRVAA